LRHRQKFERRYTRFFDQSRSIEHSNFNTLGPIACLNLERSTEVTDLISQIMDAFETAEILFNILIHKLSKVSEAIVHKLLDPYASELMDGILQTSRIKGALGLWKKQNSTLIKQIKIGLNQIEDQRHQLPEKLRAIGDNLNEDILDNRNYLSNKMIAVTTKLIKQHKIVSWRANEEVKASSSDDPVEQVEREPLSAMAEAQNSRSWSNFEDSQEMCTAHNIVNSKDQRFSIETVQEMSSTHRFVPYNKMQRAANTVCLIRTPVGAGTGFLAQIDGYHFILTNNHVIPNPTIATQSVASFNYIDADDTSSHIQIELEPLTFFYTSSSEVLDYTAIGYSLPKVASRNKSAYDLSKYEDCILDMEIEIYQHPDSRPLEMSQGTVKEILNDTYVIYNASTDYGSSGGLVLGGNFEVVAIHHQRVQDRKMNRGVLMSKVVGDLRSLLSAIQMRPIDKALMSPQEIVTITTLNQTIQQWWPRLSATERRFVTTKIADDTDICQISKRSHAIFTANDLLSDFNALSLFHKVAAENGKDFITNHINQPDTMQPSEPLITFNFELYEYMSGGDYKVSEKNKQAMIEVFVSTARALRREKASMSKCPWCHRPRPKT
jgi:hypothetical protein